MSKLMGWLGPMLGTGAGLLMQGANRNAQYNQQKKLQELQIKGQKELGRFNQQQAMDMWEKTNYSAQAEQMEKAGLSKALMYGGGGAGGATTQGAQAGAVTGGQADGEASRMMAQAQTAQTVANLELTKAQTEKTKQEAAKIGGVDTKLGETQIANLTQGIQNQKAVELLTKAQTVMQGLQNNITERTTDQQIELAEWTTEKALTDLKLARNEEYISSATINEKVGIIQQEAITSVLQNVAIKQGVELSQEQINKMKADIAQGWQKLALEADKNRQGWEGLSIQERQIKINEFTETIKANNPSIMNVAGGVVDNTINMLLDLPRKMGLGFGGRTQPYKIDK